MPETIDCPVCGSVAELYEDNHGGEYRCADCGWSKEVSNTEAFFLFGDDYE